MSHLRLGLAIVLSLTLLAACAPPVLPPVFPCANVTPCPSVTPCPGVASCPPTPSCPDCQTFLHVVSLYGDTTAPIHPALTEALPALHDYPITAQQFTTDPLVTAVAPPDAPFKLSAPLVAAIARHVDDPQRPSPLPDANKTVLWRLYLRGAQGRTEINCEPSTKPTSFTFGLVWQEVYANLPVSSVGQKVYASVHPIVQVCYLPSTATQEEIGEHAMDASFWVDAAVFDRGESGFGLYRFEPPPPGNPSGTACRRYCSAIVSCNNVFSCFLQRVCNMVCPS